MPIPIMEGIQLFNAARGLIQEIRGKNQTPKAQIAPKTGPMSDSAFAQLLRAQLQNKAVTQVVAPPKAGETTTASTAATGPVRGQINELIAQFEDEIAALREQIGSAFENNLIDTSRELDLTMDANGNVTVANDHPDAETIEALFTAHPMLRYGFARLASTASMIETSLDTFPAGLRYFGNPQTAVNEFGTLLTGQNAPSQFHLIMGPEGIRTSFGAATTETETAA
ncbi:MAG TPA: hypothetical protein PLJ47_04975 [Candidatus Hydrogenedentes bacterium]|mgnify:CR=1 FL=1|nr:hypothetical protein [Candidatus Hydrogenedentota bacterium]